MNHWFDGLAMLHRFEVADGRVTYASRFLETKAYRAARDRGELGYSEFATDPCRSLFQRVATLFSPQLTDNGNVNLTRLGERFIAMTETPIPVQFDGETLAAAGVAYEVPGELTTAHPHLDRASGGMLNYAAKLGPRSEYRFFRLGPDADEPQVVASAPTREPAYMHSFGLTERWIVLAEFPFVVNPLSLVLSGRPYIENYRWKPDRGTRLTLLDRATGFASGPFETDPFFCFHHVNAYEEDGSVVVDMCTFDDAGLVEDLYLARLRAGAGPQIRRCRLSVDSGTVAGERLLDEGFDLPRINYGRCNERPYRYAWGAESATRDGSIGSSRATSPSGRRRRGRATAAIRASRCSWPSPAPRPRMPGRCSRWSSTGTADRRSCSSSTPPPSTNWRAPRSRATSRSASTPVRARLAGPVPPDLERAAGQHAGVVPPRAPRASAAGG